jgi:hypothetical protein
MIVYNVTKLMAGGVRMPNRFKALASIGAWVLFIMGLIQFLVGWIVWPLEEAAGLATKLPLWSAHASLFLLGAVLIVLSVCVMILRKKME